MVVLYARSAIKMLPKHIKKYICFCICILSLVNLSLIHAHGGHVKVLIKKLTYLHRFTQIHPFKSVQGTTGIQTLGQVTLAQVLPSRTQTLVYSGGGNAAHFSTTPRLTVANTLQGQRQASTTKSTVSTLNAMLLIWNFLNL